MRESILVAVLLLITAGVQHCAILPTVPTHDGLQGPTVVRTTPAENTTTKKAPAKPGEKSAILSHLEKLGDRLETMERRFAKFETSKADGDTGANDIRQQLSSAPASFAEASLLAKTLGGDGDGVSETGYGQLLQLLELIGSKVDKMDSRQELFVNQVISKIDLRMDETHTLLAEVIGKDPIKETLSDSSNILADAAATGTGIQNDRGSEATTIEASQAPPTVNVKELAQELSRELTAAFASWTTNVVEELTKSLHRMTAPFHHKVSGEIGKLHENMTDMHIGLDDVRSAIIRAEQSLQTNHQEASRMHDFTSNKISQLQDEIFQDGSTNKTNFEAIKLMFSQRFLDIETELHHQKTQMKDMEDRLHSKITESMDGIINMSDNCVTSAQNVSKQIERQYQEQSSNPMYSPSVFASAAAQSAAAAATSAAATQTIQAAATMQQVQHGGLFPHFYPVSASTHQMGHLTQTQLQIQQQQVAQFQHQQHKHALEAFEQDVAGEFYNPQMRGGSRETTSTHARSSVPMARAVSGMDGVSVGSEESVYFQRYQQERRARASQEPREHTRSLGHAGGYGSARVERLENVTRHFMGKITNMFSELFEGQTKVSTRLDRFQDVLEAMKRDVLRTFDGVENLQDRLPSGGQPSGPIQEDRSLKKHLKAISRTIEDQFKSLNVELGMLNKTVARSEDRSRHNLDIFDSALEMLVKLVNNHTDRCREEQSQLKLLLHQHHAKVGDAIHNATQAIYSLHSRTGEVLQKAQNMTAMMEIFYLALAKIERKIPDLSRLNLSNTRSTETNDDDDEDEEEEEGSGEGSPKTPGFIPARIRNVDEMIIEPEARNEPFIDTGVQIAA